MPVQNVQLGLLIFGTDVPASFRSDLEKELQYGFETR